MELAAAACAGPLGAGFLLLEMADYRAGSDGEPWTFSVAHCSLAPKALSGPLAVIVHQGNPLTFLTLSEVADIFTGHQSRFLLIYARKSLKPWIREYLLPFRGKGRRSSGMARSVTCRSMRWS